MVLRHDALRTRIDADRLVQIVDDEARLNLHEQDLRHMTEEEVTRRLARHRETYSHALFDLTQAPWDLTLLHLPGDELVAFVRIDALILDGHAIATLMRELFEGIVAPELPSPPAHEPTAVQREQAGRYWRSKLARLEGRRACPGRSHSQVCAVPATHASSNAFLPGRRPRATSLAPASTCSRTPP
ncbi:condensation domain-containing protein [Aeromonas hydrophila]